MSIQYLRTHHIRGTLCVLTGLRIGGGKDSVEIGGIDNPVIKHPHSQRPYIPGSSLKGKLRSLLEWACNSVEPTGAVWGSDNKGDYEPTDPMLRFSNYKQALKPVRPG
ncbi:MAG: type III-A CRISPR-associated RAMP protein Csm3 [Bryobacterales bacterium]|nr:type III-A CRISPR-associated RAMP protein Csm3 [Bryobacterales bacterium]